MKVYYLKVGYDSLDSNTITISQDGDRWITPAIDLFDNVSYRNYSVSRSNYGLGAAENYTWIGMEDADTGDLLTVDQIADTSDLVTEVGFREGGRFIDTSGRVDIVSMKVVSEQQPMVEVYNSDLTDPTFYRTEWEKRGPFEESDEFGIVGSARNVVLAFDFGDDLPSSDFEAYIRVEVDRTVMAPLYRHTRKMANRFPEWMDFHNQPVEGDTPEPATPNSIGMQFINAVASEWLDDINRELTYRDFQRYISTVDLEQLAWDFESINLPEHVISIKGDGVELARTHSYSEYLKLRDEDACFIDSEDDVVYTLNEYDELTINGVAHDQRIHQVWNYIDEIGMLVDLDRIHLESNDNYVKRIKDVFINRGGVGVESFKLALRRELNLWQYEGATPDSYYEGATPEILEMEDIERNSKYFAPDGMPTREFVKLVEKLSHEFPTTWGRFIWGKAIWDIAGEDYAGYGIIPYRYDVPLPSGAKMSAGVGDGEDLFVFRPDVLTGPRDFAALLKMRGRYRTTRYEYRPVTVDLVLQGEADRDYYDQPTKTVWYTVEIETTGANAGTWIHTFQLSATSDVGHENAEPTPESYGIYDVFSTMQRQTREGIDFVDPVTNVPYDGTGTIPIDDISSVTLIQGQWLAGSYQDLETQDDFEAWFSHEPSSFITNSTPDGTGISYGWASDDDGMPYLPGASVVMKSLDTEPPTAGKWYTDPFEVSVEINSQEPYTEPDPFTLDIPQIFWDPYVTDPQFRIKIASTNPYTPEGATPDPDNVEYGGLTTDQNDVILFVPSSDIDITSDATTTGTVDTNGEITFSDDATYIEFAVESGGTASSATDSYTYPIPVDVWTLFERDYQGAAYGGVVDEHGPWRYGIAPSPGNTNYLLTQYDSLTRDDFDIPNNEDWVVTWVGVENDNNRVLVWVDSNTVKPIGAGEDEEYPPEAVIESIEADTYVYTPVTIRARVKPDIPPQWYPQVHSGFFYDEEDEYYMYAKPRVETVSASDEFILQEVARQGAPIIIHTDEATPVEFRQVAFYDDSATPTTLSLTTTETLNGNGSDTLYMGYTDIFDVVVEKFDNASGSYHDYFTDQAVVDENRIVLPETTDHDSLYRVTYMVDRSFYADHDYIHEDGTQRTRLVFSEVNDYTVEYETAEYDPATPIDVPLNPLFTTQTEGFLYISFDEYSLESIRVHLSPNKVLADGHDYILISLESLDEYGNPKAHQDFTITTDWGTIEEPTITTDHDGFATTLLLSDISYTSATGTLTVSGDVNGSFEFEIEEVKEPEPYLYAVVKSDEIQADGVSKNGIFGKVLDADMLPVSGVTVSWSRARSIYELFTDTDVYDSGTVTSDANGAFEIGPFTAEINENTGFWFIAVEATISGTPVGDVVFWYEYPEISQGVENVGMPLMSMQAQRGVNNFPEYGDSPAVVTKYKEDEVPEPATPNIVWSPPSWYAVSAYQQWKYGLTGNKNYTIM